MTSWFLSHPSEDKGLCEHTTCICFVERLFFIRYTQWLLGCGTKRDLGLVMGLRRWGSKVKSCALQKSRDAIQNMNNTGKKRKMLTIQIVQKYSNPQWLDGEVKKQIGENK